MYGGFALALKQIFTHWDLLRELVSRELKIRYRRSVLGFLWTLITPLYQIVIFTFVIKYVMGVRDIRNLSVHMLVAIIPWTYFSVSILNACASILRFRGVVKKVYFPRHMLPLATVGANLVHLWLSLGVLLLVFALIPVAFHPIFFFLIVLIVGETLLVCGLALMAACAHTYYQDVEYILGNILQVAMFITPVLYPFYKLNGWPEIYRIIYMLNPMAVYCEGWRSLLMYKEYPDFWYLGICLGVSVLTFIIGLAIWQRYEWRFPEVI